MKMNRKNAYTLGIAAILIYIFIIVVWKYKVFVM